MRIFHFSDIHFSSFPRELSSLFDKRIFGFCNFLLRRKSRYHLSYLNAAIRHIQMSPPDMVICTGDITTLSDPIEFKQALDCLHPLYTDSRFDFLYVPGNHDYYVHRQKNKTALEQAFYTLNKNRWKLTELPLIYQWNSMRFLLVDQTHPMPLWSSSGNIKPNRVEWLRTILENDITESSPLILVGHFPLLDQEGEPLPRRRRCYNNEVLQKALSEGKIILSICGHIHDPFIRTYKGLEYCAGSLSLTGLLNEITIDNDKISQQWIPCYH